VVFLSGCSSLGDDIDLEAVRVPVEPRPKERPSYDRASAEEADANTRRRSTGIVKYQIPGDSAFYILNANTPSEDCILDFDYAGMIETGSGPVLFYAYQALYYSSDETGLGGQPEKGTAPEGDTKNYMDRRTEKDGGLYYGSCGFHIDKERNTWSRLDHIEDFGPYEDLDISKEEYINASEYINTVFMSYCPATREYRVLYHSMEEYQPTVKRLLASAVAATGTKSGSHIAQIPDYFTHEIINTGENRSYTFYYRGTMYRFDDSGLISGPTNIREHLDRLSEQEKEGDLFKEMTLLDATMDTDGSIILSVLMEDPNIAGGKEDPDEEDLTDKDSRSTQWTITIHNFDITETKADFDQWVNDPEAYHKRPPAEKKYFVSENSNAEAQKKHFMEYDGQSIPLEDRPSMEKEPSVDRCGLYVYHDKSLNIALYKDIKTHSRGEVYMTTWLCADDVGSDWYDEKNRVYVSYRFVATPVYHLVKARGRLMVGMMRGPVAFRPRYERVTRTYELYWYETETDESGEHEVLRTETVTETMDILRDYELHFLEGAGTVNPGVVSLPGRMFGMQDFGICEMERDAADTYPFRDGILLVDKAQGDDPDTALRLEHWNNYFSGFRETYRAEGLRNAYAVYGDYNYGMLGTIINQEEGGVTLIFPQRNLFPTNVTVTNKDMNFAVGEGDSYSLRLEELDEHIRDAGDTELEYSADSLLDLHNEQAIVFHPEERDGDYRWTMYLAGPVNGLVKACWASWSDLPQISQVTPCTTYAVRLGKQSASLGKLWLIGFNTTEYTYDTADIPCALLYQLDPYGAEACASMAASYLVRHPEFVKKWNDLEKAVGIDGDWADKLLVNDYKEFLTEGEQNQLLAAKEFYRLIGLEWPGGSTNADIPEDLLACRFPADLERLAAKLRPDLNNSPGEVDMTEESYEIREHESPIEQPTNPQEETSYTIADDVNIAETDPTRESQRVDSHDVVFSAVSNVRNNLLAMHGNMDTDLWIQEMNEIAYGLRIPETLKEFYLKKAVLLYTGMAGIAVSYDTSHIVEEFKSTEAIEDAAVWAQETPFENEAQREVQKVRILNALRQRYGNRRGKDSWERDAKQILVYLDRGGFLSGLKSSAKRLQRDNVNENFGDGREEAENVDLMRKIREPEETKTGN
ncbi:MAG: hypothetical protein J5947_06535, partial [Clostridium sp.]|nr:hypothetical protein [Clostridium sp.]